MIINTTILNELDKNGFYLLKNKLNTFQTNIAKECIKTDNTMNYTKMKSFIKSDLLDIVNKNLNWDIIYTKFRVSNNNNSVDASAFHRDIFAINNKALNKKVPIFTILTYLDKTTMEIIPESHKYISMNILTSIKMFRKSITLTINVGDILIFNSTLLHRGIFTENLENRRLIQVFDCFPNIVLFTEFNNTIYHVPSQTSNIAGSAVIEISKIKPIISIYNILAYINASFGYGMPIKIYNSDNYLFFSSEGGCKRIKIINNTYQPLNKYYLNYDVNDLPEQYYSEFKYICYYHNVIITVLIIMLSIYLIQILFRKYIFRINERK